MTTSFGPADAMRTPTFDTRAQAADKTPQMLDYRICCHRMTPCVSPPFHPKSRAIADNASIVSRPPRPRPQEQFPGRGATPGSAATANEQTPIHSSMALRGASPKSGTLAHGYTRPLHSRAGSHVTADKTSASSVAMDECGKQMTYRAFGAAGRSTDNGNWRAGLVSELRWRRVAITVSSLTLPLRSGEIGRV